jgi:hypothetical protein
LRPFPKLPSVSPRRRSRPTRDCRKLPSREEIEQLIRNAKKRLHKEQMNRIAQEEVAVDEPRLDGVLSAAYLFLGDAKLERSEGR